MKVCLLRVLKVYLNLLVLLKDYLKVSTSKVWFWSFIYLKDFDFESIVCSKVLTEFFNDLYLYFQNSFFKENEFQSLIGQLPVEYFCTHLCFSKMLFDEELDILEIVPNKLLPLKCVSCNVIFFCIFFFLFYCYNCCTGNFVLCVE